MIRRRIAVLLVVATAILALLSACNRGSNQEAAEPQNVDTVATSSEGVITLSAETQEETEEATIPDGQYELQNFMVRHFTVGDEHIEIDMREPGNPFLSGLVASDIAVRESQRNFLDVSPDAVVMFGDHRLEKGTWIHTPVDLLISVTNGNIMVEEVRMSGTDIPGVRLEVLPGYYSYGYSIDGGVTYDADYFTHVEHGGGYTNYVEYVNVKPADESTIRLLDEHYPNWRNWELNRGHSSDCDSQDDRTNCDCNRYLWLNLPSIEILREIEVGDILELPLISARTTSIIFGPPAVGSLSPLSSITIVKNPHQ
ncbi:hypothetical protein FWH09_03400 [Candidatus Saccharibacteria bacterium]|nr:hypothetical protein [Candidatus Saccharibacteria bacterium]